jgi:hypothetical protein
MAYEYETLVQGESLIITTLRECIHIIKSQDKSFGIATSYRLGFNSRQREKIFLYSAASTLALGSTQPPIHWLPEALS